MQVRFYPYEKGGGVGLVKKVLAMLKKGGGENKNLLGSFQQRSFKF